MVWRRKQIPTVMFWIILQHIYSKLFTITTDFILKLCLSYFQPTRCKVYLHYILLEICEIEFLLNLKILSLRWSLQFFRALFRSRHFRSISHRWKGTETKWKTLKWLKMSLLPLIVALNKLERKLRQAECLSVDWRSDKFVYY